MNEMLKHKAEKLKEFLERAEVVQMRLEEQIIKFEAGLSADAKDIWLCNNFAEHTEATITRLDVCKELLKSGAKEYCNVPFTTIVTFSEAIKDFPEYSHMPYLATYARNLCRWYLVDWWKMLWEEELAELEGVQI